jgi:catechol-2,3-dioxygenase
MTSPVKLSHLVLQTNRIAALRDWYVAVLGGEIVHENPNICFISYDEEHHRIALLNFGPLTPKAENQVGLNHVAFTFASLGTLIETYERLEAQGIQPHWCINHGPTTSMYYHDPDGNGVELQVDNFADVADCKAYMRGPAFAANILGIEFDPKVLAKRLRSGVPERVLLDRESLATVLA